MSGKYLSPLAAVKHLFQKPHTIRFPKETKPTAERYRGFHVTEWDKCIGCGNCRDICPPNAINMTKIADLQKIVDLKKGEKPERPSIDYGRCCFCGLCVDICPTSAMNLSQDYIMVDTSLKDFKFLPDETRQDRESWQAGHEESFDKYEREEMREVSPAVRKKSFTEMVLGYPEKDAIAEANRCMECGVCMEACPAHMDIPKYIRAIALGDNKKSVEIMYHTNDMLMTCGRICTHNCESACALQNRGEAVAIRWLKRYAVDHVEVKDFPKYEVPVVKKAPKVAIVGGGPGGLSAAFYLSINGIIPTIYDRHTKLGGMVRYAVPKYRLNDESLDKDINYMLSYGTKVKTGVKVGHDITLNHLLNHFDLVYMAVGLQAARQLKVSGSDHRDVVSALDFLFQSQKEKAKRLGKDIIVIGGGNVAMDVARSAARLQMMQYGKVSVKVVSLESMNEMPADPDEIKEGSEEGVTFIPSRSMKEVILKNKKIEKIKAIKVTSVFDEQGRFAPAFNTRDVAEIKGDMIIQSIGQTCPFDCFKASKLLDRIKFTPRRKVDIQNDFQTSIKGLFAGGDITNVKMDAISAIANGRDFAFGVVKKHLKKDPIR